MPLPTCGLRAQADVVAWQKLGYSGNAEPNGWMAGCLHVRLGIGVVPSLTAEGIFPKGACLAAMELAAEAVMAHRWRSEAICRGRAMGELCSSGGHRS
jgi:hypothetical protein